MTFSVAAAELQSSGGAIEQSPEPRPALGEVEGTSRLSGATIPVSGPAPYDTCLEYAPPPLASGPFSHPASSLWLPDLTTLDVASLAPDHGLSSALPSSLSDSSTSLAPQQLPAAPYGRSSALELLPPCPLDHLLPPLPLFAPDPVAPLAVSAAAPDGLRQTGTEGLSACGASPLGAPPDHEGIGTSGEAYTDGQLADGWEGGEAVGGKRLAEGVPDSLAEDSLEGDESLDPAGAAARPCKRPRLVWTPELHTRFLNAVNHLVRCPARPAPLPCDTLCPLDHAIGSLHLQDMPGMLRPHGQLLELNWCAHDTLGCSQRACCSMPAQPLITMGSLSRPPICI